MDPTIDPGYGESMIQPRPGETREELLARYQDAVRERRAETLKTVRKLLSKEALSPPWWWYAIGAVLTPVVLAVAFLALSLLCLISAALSLVASPVLAVVIYRRLRRKDAPEPDTNDSSTQEVQA